MYMYMYIYIYIYRNPLRHFAKDRYTSRLIATHHFLILSGTIQLGG